jgi:hypothetical protein
MTSADLLHRHSVELATRRFFLKTSMACVGGMAFNTLLNDPALAATGAAGPVLHHPAKAKRVIYVHLAGAPSQIETFDYKPELAKLDGQVCPDSFLKGKRFAFIKGVPKMMGPQVKFAQHGQNGAWVSDDYPELAKLTGKMCFVKSMWTEQFNHAPAQLMLQKLINIKGRP